LVTGFTITRLRANAQPQRVFDHHVVQSDFGRAYFNVVDIIWLAGNEQPWFVIERNECKCWSFLLVSHIDGAWKITVEGANGCTP